MREGIAIYRVFLSFILAKIFDDRGPDLEKSSDRPENRTHYKMIGCRAYTGVIHCYRNNGSIKLHVSGWILHEPSRLDSTMPDYSHAIFIDESGNGSDTDDINKYWVSAAIAIPFERMESIDEKVKSILKSNFRSNIREIKGADIPHGLNQGKSTTDVARDVGNLVEENRLNCWIVGSHQGVNPPTGLSQSNPMVKEIVRHLLLERINHSLHTTFPGDTSYMTIWDISDQQDLQDFSRSVSAFNDLYRNTPRSKRMVPAVLGGISHDWSGLQIADILANYGLHHICVIDGSPGGRKNKADDFGLYLKPRLQRDARNDPLGWKRW